MSGIHSKVEAIERLRLEPFPARPRGSMRCVRIDRTIVAWDGVKAYSTQIKASCYYVGNRAFPETFQGLKRLGVLTKAQIDEHANYLKVRQEIRDGKYAADALMLNAAKLGIKLTKAQQVAAGKALAREGA